MVNSEGSVFIATANDNAVGMYTCTAYNSYGTMGQSEPTQVILQVRLGFSSPSSAAEETFYSERIVINGHNEGLFLLQDPPTFRVPPRAEYLQEVGRQLIIPCVASGDPTPNITWSKVQVKVSY